MTIGRRAARSRNAPDYAILKDRPSHAACLLYGGQRIRTNDGNRHHHGASGRVSAFEERAGGFSADRTRTFERAQRHSAACSSSRFRCRHSGGDLPVVRFLLAATRCPPSRSKSGRPPISDGKLVMANPKLDGFTKEAALLDDGPAGVTDLTQTASSNSRASTPRCRSRTRTWAEINASRGVYDRDSNTMIYPTL